MDTPKNTLPEGFTAVGEASWVVVDPNTIHVISGMIRVKAKGKTAKIIGKARVYLDNAGAVAIVDHAEGEVTSTVNKTIVTNPGNGKVIPYGHEPESPTAKGSGCSTKIDPSKILRR